MKKPRKKGFKSKDLTEKERFILERIPINVLYREGIIKSKDLKHVEKRICELFGIKNIYMWDYIGKPKRKPVVADIRTFSMN